MLQLTTNDIVNKLVTKDLDLKGRRVINAANSKDAQDYVTQYELQNNLPAPGLNTLGGVKQSGKIPHKWVAYIDGQGNPVLTQPAFTDISGTLSLKQLPSDPAVAHQFVTSVNTSGAVLRAQPAFSDLSGSIAVGQLPATVLPIAAQQVVTGSRALGGNYQNATGKPMIVTVSSACAQNQGITVFSDAAASPTTQITNVYNTLAGTVYLAVTFVVLANNWYRVGVTGTPTLSLW